MKINHFGFLTKNIEKSLKQHKALGYQAISPVTYDEDRGVDIQFIQSSCGQVVELISPSKQAQNSIVEKLIPKLKNSIYHTCYEVDDISKTVQELLEKNFLLISEPQPAIAFNNKKVCFLSGMYVGIIELVER